MLTAWSAYSVHRQCVRLIAATEMQPTGMAIAHFESCDLIGGHACGTCKLSGTMRLSSVQGLLRAVNKENPIRPA